MYTHCRSCNTAFAEPDAHNDLCLFCDLDEDFDIPDPPYMWPDRESELVVFDRRADLVDAIVALEADLYFGGDDDEGTLTQRLLVLKAEYEKLEPSTPVGGSAVSTIG